MNTWQLGDVLDAAVQTLINERCRPAYMHEMRGGLHEIHTSFELLARSAKHGGQNEAMIDNASLIAKRAMAHHEQALVDIVNQVTGPDDAPTAVNLSSVVKQAQHFLRNDALSKGITMKVFGCEDVPVLSRRNKLRSLILGLLALGIDASPKGAELQVELSRADGYALLELRSELTYGVIRKAADLLCREPVELVPQELVLGFARQWIVANGGRVEMHPAAGKQTGLRIYYPLAAS